MNTSPIHSLTPVHQKSDAAATAAPTPTAEQRQVAQQFEAIFMRQLLGSLEQAGGLGGNSTGGGVYRSMMVGALADSAASGGGIGLAELVLKAMVPEAAVPHALRDLASGPAPEGPAEFVAKDSLTKGSAERQPSGASGPASVGIPLSSPVVSIPLSAAAKGIPLTAPATSIKPLIRSDQVDLR